MSTKIYTLIMNENIHMSSKNCVESGYGIELNLVTNFIVIACFTYPRRSGLLGIHIHLRVDRLGVRASQSLSPNVQPVYIRIQE